MNAKATLGIARVVVIPAALTWVLTQQLGKPLSVFNGNDRVGGDGFEFKYDGHNVPIEWHIKNGGNTRDPRRGLRIYYFWDEDRQTVVIASMPAHIRTGAT